MILRALVIIQIFTFVPAAYIFTKEGDWRLGGAQLLLAFVQGLIYLK